jgi:hypothetical protein
MKKLVAITLCVVTALSFTACNKNAPAKDNTNQFSEQNNQIPSPFEDCTTIADAEIIAGFTLILPEKMPKDYIKRSIQAIKDDMVQVFYENGESELLVRKAKGNQDISGDYNQYSENSTMNVDDLQVTTRGNNGKVNVATWVNGEYTYSVGLYKDEPGLDTDTIKDIVSIIK